MQMWELEQCHKPSIYLWGWLGDGLLYCFSHIIFDLSNLTFVVFKMISNEYNMEIW